MHTFECSHKPCVHLLSFKVDQREVQVKKEALF